MRLGGRINDRDNNFNLIRMVAASLVLVSHSFTLATGNASLEPFRAQIGASLGTLSVDVFFVISGLLVTASAERLRSTSEFFKRRALRIYPGLLVMLLATLLIGAINSTLPLSEFFASPITQHYFAKCSTLVTDVAYALPGVFLSNPYPIAVNGSLWTLPVEVRLYLLLGLVYLLLNAVPRDTDRIKKAIALIVVLSSFAFLLLVHFGTSKSTDYIRLYYAFSSGVALHALRQHIRLDGRVALAGGILLVGAFLLQPRWFLPVYAVLLPYLVICVAYIPRGICLSYNRIGDYSYGMYIYAFPIQQMTAHVIPGIGPMGMIATAFPLTFLAAILSWHLVEERFLGLKSRGRTANAEALC